MCIFFISKYVIYQKTDRTTGLADIGPLLQLYLIENSKHHSQIVVVESCDNLRETNYMVFIIPYIIVSLWPLLIPLQNINIRVFTDC